MRLFYRNIYGNCNEDSNESQAIMNLVARCVKAHYISPSADYYFLLQCTFSTLRRDIIFPDGVLALSTSSPTEKSH